MIFNGVIVDTYKKTQYVPLLEIIGCHRSGTREGLDCIMEAADEMIKDEKFREGIVCIPTSSCNAAETSDTKTL